MIKFRSKPSGIAQRNDHLFLPFVAQAFSPLFQFCQCRGDHTRPSQQIEGCTLSVVDLSGNRGREPQTGFGITCAQGFLYGLVVIGAKSGLIEKFDKDSGLRLEDGAETSARRAIASMVIPA